MAGSIVEGARLGNADELDLTLQFEAMLPEHFKIEDSALKFHLTESGRTLIKDFTDDNGCLNMTTFLKTLLETLLFCFSDSSTTDKLPTCVTTVKTIVNWVPCNLCKEKNLQRVSEPWTHCQNCIPTVSMTKAGPCIVLKHNNMKFSIDIIPMFPSPICNTVELYRLVTRTLITEQPHCWQTYLERFKKNDCILPETIALVENTSYICLKVCLLYTSDAADE